MQKDGTDEQYKASGFEIMKIAEESIKIRPLFDKINEIILDSKDPLDKDYNMRDVLFCQCSTNIAVFGPKGSIIINPSKNGLVISKPSGGLIKLRPIQKWRKLLKFNDWFIDIIYGISRTSTDLTEASINSRFKIKEGSELIIERKIRHKLDDFKSRYSVTIHKDNSITISLPNKNLLDKFWDWWLSFEVKEVKLKVNTYPLGAEVTVKKK